MPLEQIKEGGSCWQPIRSNKNLPSLSRKTCVFQRSGAFQSLARCSRKHPDEHEINHSMNQYWQQGLNRSAVSSATCILTHSEYSVVMFSLALEEFTKVKAEGGVNVCDRSSWLFTHSFLPPFPPPLPFNFPGPSTSIQRAFPAAGPGPMGSSASGPPGCDLATRPAGLAQLG